MARRLRRLGAYFLATLVIVLPIATHEGAGQVARKTKTVEKGEEPKFTDAVTLPRNPESKRLIQAAQDYIKKKEWRIAAECLQSLLETPDDSFIEIRRKDAGGVEQDLKVSVREEANRIIGELPADGLESYQLQYGQKAADRLREAVEKADPAILAEVSQRYLHTKSGLEATNLLGTYHLDRGQYLMATLCFERLLSRPDADKLSPKILYKAAIAYRRAGNAANSDKLMAKVADKVGRGDVVFGRTHFTASQLQTELTRDPGHEAFVRLFDWPIYRGNPSRTAQGVGSTAYLEHRWSSSLIQPDDPIAEADKPAVAWIRQHLEIACAALKDKPILPAFFPITAQGQLLVRTYDGVAAYRLKPSEDGRGQPGELLWRANAENGLFRTIKNDENGRRMAIQNWYDQYYRGNNIGPMGVFFENSVLGSLSHDGRRVYFIDDLAVPPHSNQLNQFHTPFNNPAANLGPFTNEAKYNRLCAADFDTEGKASWTALGGLSNTTAKPKDAKEERKELSAATELLDSFFLGPPLPLGGKLYVLTERKGEIRLVCLDPEKLVPSPIAANDRVPELLWVQTLGVANHKLPMDGLRRLQAAHLAYSDGILVCPTNAGAVIGVDLLTHSLVWAYSYRKSMPTNPDEMMFNRRGRGFPNPSGSPVGERWRPSAPCIVKGKVILTAHDGSEVHCLNLRDGQRHWTSARDDANDLYLAGVFDDRVLIIGKNSARALDLDTGKEVWKRTELGLPSGQGVASNGIYFLPLANSTDPRASDKGPEICALDIKSGNVVGRSKSPKETPGNQVRETPGNLLFVDGELISQTVYSVSSFPLLKVKQEEINRSLAKNPNDPAGLAERGELHMYNGEVKEAVEDLRKALANQPPDAVRVKARTKLHEALTLSLQSDFAATEKYLPEYEELCNVEIPADARPEERQKRTIEGIRRRASFLELVGKGRQQQGRVLEAFAAYEKYGELAGHKELVDSIEEPNTKSRPDIWSRGRIQALLASAGPADKKLLEDEIARRWEKVRTGEGPDGLRQFVNLYGSISSAGKTARLELCERLLATGVPDDLTEAERLLAALCYSLPQHRDDPAITAKALEMMIRVCVRRGQYENAVGFYKQLGAEFGNVPVRNGQTGRELLDELNTDKRFLPYLEAPAVIWPGPLVSREQHANPTFSQRDISMTIEPIGAQQPFFARHRLVLEMKNDGGQNSWMLRLLDRVTGEERWRVPNLPAAYYFNNDQARMPFAFARGHDLILHLNNKIFAFDLVERKELWQKNLFGNDLLLTTQNNPNLVFDAETSSVMVVSSDSRRTYLGRVAVVEGSYVCLQTREGLVALDPTRPGPSVMWQKTDVSPKAQIFGDDQHVFVFDPEADKSRPKFVVLRSQDGIRVPAPVEPFHEAFGKRIRTIGGAVLVSEPDAKAIRLYDALTGKDLWKREFAGKSTVVKCQDATLIGAIEPGGLFTLLDVRTGKVIFTSHLRPEQVENLRQATLLADRDRFYLALSQVAEEGLSWQSAANPGIRTVEINGPLYALSRRTGKLEWICPFLPHQQLLLEQHADLPVLLFASQYTKSGRTEQQGVQVTGVDKTTGKLILYRGLTPSTPFHALTANPSSGKIELVRQDLKLMLITPQAAGAPEPPAPPTTSTTRRTIGFGRIAPVPQPAPAPQKP